MTGSLFEVLGGSLSTRPSDRSLRRLDGRLLEMPVAGYDYVAIPPDRPEELIAFYGALGFIVYDR